jgi:hypothetical protein
MLCHQLTGLIAFGTDEQADSDGAAPDSSIHAAA